MRGIRLSRVKPIWLYIAALSGGALALWLGVLRHLGPAPAADAGVPWWGLAIVFCLTEAYVVHLHFRREAHTISLNELALVVGFYLLSPTGLILAHLSGAGAALVFKRRQRRVKLAFNLAQFAFTTSVALVVFRGVCSLGNPFGFAGWGAALLGTSVASILGILLVTGAIALAQGDLEIRLLAATSAIAMVATVTTANLALVGVQLARTDARTFVLLALPAAAVVVAFRSFVEQKRRHEHLEFLYESMKATQSAPEFSLAIGQLLISVRHLVRAEYAEIFLFPSGSEPGLRSTLGAHGEMVSRPDAGGPADQMVLELIGATDEALALPAQRAPHLLDGYLAVRKLPDGILATLRGEGGPFGLLLVGDRAGDVDTFTEEDRRLLETFTGHASVLLENGRLERTLANVTELKEKLRHQAYHDILTGLPNRALFAERVAAAIELPRGDLVPAVLFLDLDDFKAVNDSRGHSAGDALLVQVAARVNASVRPGDVPARLGGDEFGVLLEPTTREGAEIAAERLISSFAKPFMLEGRETYVHGSVGIALADECRSADELLRNADVAMYSAKTRGRRRFAHYEPSMHAEVRKRHDLALELEHAVERNEITVAFQPIVSLRDGYVVAFEALARWHHPQRGLIAPGEFIPVAEATGMMEPIGHFVLQQACDATREWQQEYPDLAGVTVNLSPSQLASDRFVDSVARMLVESCLGSDSLTLEITESAVMRDVESLSERLEELRSLGVRLALDDFGTGYSSLERLDSLPMNILKIAKPFVDRLNTSPDTRFVDTFVRLAYSLGMTCVAEGIEHEIQVPRLLDGGCGLGQGFLFAPPMSRAEVDRYLRTAPLVKAGM
jgi:diguanylate cyclase (GGDEF)-like protein